MRKPEESDFEHKRGAHRCYFIYNGNATFVKAGCALLSEERTPLPKWTDLFNPSAALTAGGQRILVFVDGILEVGQVLRITIIQQRFPFGK